jgi:hypothetical protein
MFRCVGFVPRFLSTAVIIAIIATALRLIPHNLLKRLIWPVFSAYSSGRDRFLRVLPRGFRWCAALLLLQGRDRNLKTPARTMTSLELQTLC